MSDAKAYMDVDIRIRAIKILHETPDLPRKAGLEVKHLATPELALWKDTQIEPGDDTKVVTAAFQRNPEVRVSLGVGLDYLATSENDLVADDVIAYEASRVGEV